MIGLGIFGIVVRKIADGFASVKLVFLAISQKYQCESAADSKFFLRVNRSLIGTLVLDVYSILRAQVFDVNLCVLDGQPHMFLAD